MVDSWSPLFLPALPTLAAPGPAAARRGIGRRAVLTRGACCRRRLGRAGGHQLVRWVDHDRAVASYADLAAESDPAPAVQPGDVRASVEQGGQLAGRVGDLRSEHGVALDRADLHRVYAALHRGLAWLGQGPDGPHARRGDRPVIQAAVRGQAG